MPQAEIYLIGHPGSESLVKRFSKYFTGFIALPGYPGLPEQPYDIKSISSFISYMKEQQFDLLLQMQGNGTKVNQLIELLGARYSGGFYTRGDYQPPGELFIAYPDEGHEIERHFSLIRHLGVQGESVDLEFPVDDLDETNFKRLKLLPHDSTYVCIHPGTKGNGRQWPRENFARMGDLCASMNLQVVITGTAEEAVIVHEVADKMKYSPVVAAGKTNLGAMAILLSNARALVANCSGISQMAAALKVPGIIISMDGERHRWAPLDKNLFYTIDWLKDPDFNKTESALLWLIKNGNFSDRDIS